MRKITIFSTLISFFVAVFFGMSTVNAQFAYSKNDVNSPKVQVCGDGGRECTLEKGLQETGKSLNGQVTEKKASEFLQDVVIYFLGFTSVIGVIYIIWAGFNILIGNGDENKLSEAKKTVLYVAGGMVLMWLAYSIINLIIATLGKTAYQNSSPRSYFALNFIPTASAQAQSESELGTFSEYKNKVQIAIEELETELRVDKKVSESKLLQVQALVQAAFDRLPDKDLEAARINESAKRAVDLYIKLALKNPESTQAVGEAISKIAAFINNAKTDSIKGTISATPTSGNAPLVVSFSAQNVIDPSGTIPPPANYIWWVRENGGIRKELGRGPSLTHEFPNEGTYIVNLDVLSASKNSKGKTDILPLTTSVTIDVQPKIGEITLLINGKNVSNLSSLKISPTIASQGVIFDASASRAIGNGKILETTWDFGTGPKLQYKSAPSVERQVFATSGKFPIKLSFKTNDGQVFTKELELIVIDPAATIKVDKQTTHVGEQISFTAETHLGDLRNVEYLWTVQNEDGKRDTKSSNGLSFSHTFTEIGSYIVTLTAKSPNGGIDTDSKIITVESREPIANLDVPVQVHPEKPDTFIFDASRSYDPDTNNREGLTFSWKLNNKAITLDPIEGDKTNSKGTLTFDSVGDNVISVTVANKFGKIATAEQKFRVNSVLSGNLIIAPQAAKLGDPMHFIAHSKNAQFYTWNMGDGTTKSGANKTMTHQYKTTGVYTVTVTLQGGNATDTTTLSKKVYVTDADSPVGIMSFSNSSNSVIVEPNVCEGKDAYVLKRGENTSMTASNSINIDGTTSNLDYTWKFMGKVSTLPTINETFRDLGCFPIELTVRSKTNGATHKSVEYIKLQNQLPQITNITTTVDSNKKDSQKIIVKATANGVSDSDGVITSYIWYYTTETDKEPQGLQITQSPQMTFVLPNVTEKYYFGVIIEDNDGARINSADLLKSQPPLVIDNENGNINMPLIKLTIPNKALKVGQQATFTASASTITGTNITNKAQYSWDFDGDGRVDEKTSTPTISHTYTKAGDYTLRLRVTYNGVSNTKYHTINVRNELKAGFQGYKIPGDKVFLMNTSQGSYDKVKWTIGSNISNHMESVILSFDDIPQADEKGVIGNLHVSHNDTDISTANITINDLQTIQEGSEEIQYQSYPQANNDTITVKDPSESVKIALYGNKATNFGIDSNLDMDSDLDGTYDNDIDNRESNSYHDGSVFTISDFAQSTQRERKVKLILYEGNTPIKTKIITLVLDFIEIKKEEVINPNNPDLADLSEFEKTKLDQLAGMIRELPDAPRIVIMQEYNILVENWESSFEKAKNLVDIQQLIDSQDDKTISPDKKSTFHSVIDELLIGDANVSNEILIATTLIKKLLPPDSPNYNEMVARIDAIASHPTNTKLNRQLGNELIEFIKQEPRERLNDNYGVIIYQQLKFIVSRGEDTTPVPEENKSSGGIGGIFGGIIKIILIIFAIITGGVVILYVMYKMSKKNEDMGFQDYIIDLVAHKKPDNDTLSTPIQTVTPPKAEETKTADIDPLKSYVPPEDPLGIDANPVAEEQKEESGEANMPDWLKTPEAEAEAETAKPVVTEEAILPNTPKDPLPEATGGLPDWLQPTTTEANTSSQIQEETPAPSNDPLLSNSEGEATGELPDWLQPAVDTNATNQTSTETEENMNSQSTGALPDWLAQSAEVQTENVTNPGVSQNPETTGTMPDWLKTDEEVTENQNNTPTADVLPTTEPEALPDWLTANSENTETATPSEIQDNQNQEENSTEKNSTEFDLNSPYSFSYTQSKGVESPTQEAPQNAELPSWITDIAEEQKEEQPISELQDQENSEENNSSSEEVAIPDWLKDSAINTETTEMDTPQTLEAEEGTQPTEVTEVSVPKKGRKKKETKNVTEDNSEEIVSKKRNTRKKETSPENTPDNDIPEWLK